MAQNNLQQINQLLQQIAKNGVSAAAAISQLNTALSKSAIPVSGKQTSIIGQGVQSGSFTTGQLNALSSSTVNTLLASLNRMVLASAGQPSMANPGGRPATPPGGGSPYPNGFEKWVRGVSAVNDTERDKIRAYYKQLEDSLGTFGKTIQFSNAKVTELKDGMTRLDVSAKDSSGHFQKLVLYVNQYGKVLNEAEKEVLDFWKAQDQLLNSQKAPQRLDVENKIGQFRSGKAYALAAQHGFGQNTLQQVKIEQPANIAQMTFAMQDQQGIVQKLVVDVDQYGHALTRTNRRLLSFTDSLTRNTAEMFKWSIGAMLIYGTYSKLGELITKAIENQTKLADVTVALGSAQRNVNDIFASAAEIANETGETVDGVLESYTMAYRAVGSISEPYKRAASAEKLLTDATILNKLSNLDAAESIDILSGAIRQAQSYYSQFEKKPLDTAQAIEKGTDILDKWVKVTRIANVDMATLATAFSVTAESALNAGVTIEELNAIIASLSEKIGGLGGKETGNAVRALIGGVYQEQAATALNQYGIAVQDSEGKMRDFLSISRDIFELYNSGIIDDTQLNKLAYTLGGGVRRGQQYVAFLKDQSRIQEIVNQQTNAAGSAAAAMEIKMGTLQTSTSRLNNAFQGLAQSLGTNGGIIDLMTGGTEATTGFVNILKDLTNLLGRVTIPATLLALLGTYNLGGSANQAKSGAFLQAMGSPFGNMVSRMLNPVKNWGQYQYQNGTVSPVMSPFAIRGGMLAGSAFPGIAMGAIPALSKLGEGDTKGAATTFGASVAGAIAGAMVGGPVGSMIGSTIGAFIADTFTSGVKDHEAEFTALFAEVNKNSQKIGVSGEADLGVLAREKAVNDAYELLSKTQTGGLVGNVGLGKGFNRVETTLRNLIGGYGDTGANASEQEVLFSQLRGMVKTGDLDKAVVDALEAQIKEAGRTVKENVNLEDTEFYKTQKRLAEENLTGQKTIVDFIDQISEEYRKELAAKQRAGEITPREYKNAVQSSFPLSSNVLRLGTALSLGGEMGKYGKSAEEQWKNLSNLIKEASIEDVASINAIVGEIQDLGKFIEETKDKIGEFDFKGDMLDAVEAGDLLKKKYEELIGVLEAVAIANEQAKLDEFKPLSPVLAEGADPEKLMARAQELQSRELGYQVENELITQDQVDSAITNAEPILIDLGEKMGYYIANGITDSKYIQQAIQESAQLGYQFMDVTQEQLMSLMAPGGQYDQLKNQITGMGGTVNEEELITFFKDSTNPMLMKADWKIVQYLLQEILKTEEKQLDGIYNLPSGASFYVPFQAWKMDTETRQASAEGQYDFAQWDQAAYEQYTAGMQVETAATTLQATVEYWYNLLQKGLVTPEDVPKDIYEVLKNMMGRGEEINGQKVWVPEDQNQQVPGAGLVKPTEGGLADSITAWYEDYLKQQAEDAVSKRLMPDRVLGSSATGGAPSLNATAAAHSEPNPYAPPTTPWGIPGDDSGNAGWEGSLLNRFIQELTTAFQSWFGGGNPQDTTIPETPVVPETSVPPVQTSLDVNLQTQTQLVVDGRVLADIVKPYLYSDMVNFENSAGSTGTFTAA